MSSKAFILCLIGFCALFYCNSGKVVHSSKISFKNGVASLALTHCSRRDAGTYTCTAENAAGKQSSSAVLHIASKSGGKAST